MKEIKQIKKLMRIDEGKLYVNELRKCIKQRKENKQSKYKHKMLTTDYIIK